MNQKYIKYLRASYYLLGIGAGFLSASFALFEYNSSKGWFQAGFGVVSLILGGVFGTLAQKELKADK